MPSQLTFALRLILLSILALTAYTVLVARLNPLKNPDEAAHIRAAEYYLYHSLPPQIGSPGNNISRTPSGISYQDEFDIVYFLAGKFVRAIDFLSCTIATKMRLFNLLVFAVMIFVSLKRNRVVPNLIFFLIPQVWYTATYFNADMLPLLLSWAIANYLPSCLFDEKPSRRNLLIVGIAYGALLVSKRNYLVFSLFFAIFALGYGLKARRLSRLVAIGALACLVCAIRLLPDYYINGMGRNTLVYQAQQSNAHFEFKKSTPIEQRYFGFNLHERGVGVIEVLFERQWLLENFWSFTGKYGNAGYYSSREFYIIIAVALLAFLFRLFHLPCLSSLLPGPRATYWVNSWMFAFILLMIAASLRHTMLVDFQPQGRYLFPLLGMMTFVAYVKGEDQVIVTFPDFKLLAILFLCSLSSFCTSYLFNPDLQWRSDRALHRIRPRRFIADTSPNKMAQRSGPDHLPVISRVEIL